MTIVHVWSIILPTLISGWNTMIHTGSFECPLSERSAPEFKHIEMASKTGTLQVDDVFRIAEMTILLAILLPLSLTWLSTRYHIAIHLHRAIAILYSIDIVHRHTHPHSRFLNTPFFSAWVSDLFIGRYCRKRTSEVFRLHIGDNYICCFCGKILRILTLLVRSTAFV